MIPAALRVHGSRRRFQKMIKTILVPLFGTGNDAPLLELSLLAAGLYGAHIEGLHVRSSVANLIARAALIGPDVGGALISDALLEALEEGEDLRLSAARHSLLEFSKRHGLSLTESASHPISASWHEVDGDPVEGMTTRGRFADLVIVGRSPPGGEPSAGTIGTIMIGCGRPLLLAGRATPKTLAKRIAIAWKETAEAARAVGAAMPFLAKADEVTVLTAAKYGADGARTAESGEWIAARLRRHGLNVRSQGLASHKRTAADAVLETASTACADLLVMGGYGHSRVHELVFGGFTDQVLHDAPLPVLLVH
jgi:nucleotide-binding universal stress UspA family protein